MRPPVLRLRHACAHVTVCMTLCVLRSGFPLQDLVGRKVAVDSRGPVGRPAGVSMAFSTVGCTFVVRKPGLGWRNSFCTDAVMAAQTWLNHLLYVHSLHRHG